MSPKNTVTFDRFTFETHARAEADGRFQAQLMIDSGAGAARTQRLFTFTPTFTSQAHAMAYASQQAAEWMKQKSLG